MLRKSRQVNERSRRLIEVRNTIFARGILPHQSFGSRLTLELGASDFDLCSQKSRVARAGFMGRELSCGLEHTFLPLRARRSSMAGLSANHQPLTPRHWAVLGVVRLALGNVEPDRNRNIGSASERQVSLASFSSVNPSRNFFAWGRRRAGSRTKARASHSLGGNAQPSG